MGDVVRARTIVVVLDTGRRKLELLFGEHERKRVIQELRELANKLEKLEKLR